MLAASWQSLPDGKMSEAKIYKSLVMFASKLGYIYAPHPAPSCIIQNRSTAYWPVAGSGLGNHERQNDGRWWPDDCSSTNNSRQDKEILFPMVTYNVTYRHWNDLIHYTQDFNFFIKTKQKNATINMLKVFLIKMTFHVSSKIKEKGMILLTNKD